MASDVLISIAKECYNFFGLYINCSILFLLNFDNYIISLNI